MPSTSAKARIASEDQPELFAAPQQPACGRFIDDATYAAILYLRGIGCRVNRCGLSHLIDGSIRSTAQLRMVARAKGRTS